MEESTILVQIDTKKYSQKPSKTENGYITNRLRNAKAKKISLDELRFYIENGHTIRPAILSGSKNNDFISQEIFMVDVDNNKAGDILSLENIKDICTDKNLPCCMIYETFSSTEALPKYRILFILNEKVTDLDKRNFINKVLLNIFKQSDTACKNASRYFFGTNKQVSYVNADTFITFENILNNNETINNDILANTKEDTDLKKLKDNFDFLTYLKEQCGGLITENNNYITFKTCPICGHNDCFVYYKSTKSFYCYGANGNKGGTIIDFLMLTKNMTKFEAIQYFKNDLMGITKNDAKINLKSLIKGISSIQNAKDYDWILPSLFAKGFLSIIFGEGGSGKTWLLLNLALFLTNGIGEWFNIEIEKKYKVLLLEGDAPNALINTRLNKFKFNLDDEFFKYINRFEVDKQGINLNLSSKEGRNNLEFLITESNAEFIIIDTLISFVDDEKDAENIKKVIDSLRKIATKCNCHILICHHSRKKDNTEKRKRLEQSDVIGSSIITRLASVVIGIEKIDNENIIEIKKSWFKMLDSLKFELIDESENNISLKFGICSKYEGKLQNAKRKICNYLLEKQTCTRAELVDKFKEFSESTIKSALKSLEKSEQVKSKGLTKNKFFIYNNLQPN